VRSTNLHSCFLCNVHLNEVASFFSEKPSFSKRNVLGSESLHILYESKTKPNFAFHDADICSDAADQFIVADGEEHLAIKHRYPFIPKDSLLVQGQEENQGKQTNPGSPGKRPLKCRWALANNSYICKKNCSLYTPNGGCAPNLGHL